MEEQENPCDKVSDRIPPLSSKYPWFVAQNLEDGIIDQIFYTIHKPLYHYQCQIPELLGKRIRACFHGWVILSNHPHNDIWSLWDPLTSKLMCLPPLGGNFYECCLSSPPDDPTSVLLLTSHETQNIAFCRLDCKRIRLRWTKISYAKQLRRIIHDRGYLHSLTCYDGKVYALHTGDSCDFFVIQVDIAFEEKKVMINLMPFVEVPDYSFTRCSSFNRPPSLKYINEACPSSNVSFLKGSGTELFYIYIGFEDKTMIIVRDVCLFKLDVTSIKWEELEDLKDAIFFIELANEYSAFYTSAIASELGGSIHILADMGKVLYSFSVKDKTISLSSMPSLVRTSQVSSWTMLELRLEHVSGEAKSTANFKQEEDTDTNRVVRSVEDGEAEFNSTAGESNLLNIPFHVLEMIMELCVAVEYLNFRATCKHCYFAAPLIQWNNKSTLRRLKTYSLVSPWLMVLGKYRITFVDPMFGDKYYIKTPQGLTGDVRIYCSRFGWLLMFKAGGNLMFYNPFTTDIRELTRIPGLESCTFTAPPTSPDCIVVGLISSWAGWLVYIHFVAREPEGRILPFRYGAPDSLSFPTNHDGDLYALCNEGGLYAFKDLGEENYCWEHVVAKTPRNSGSAIRYFQVKCDQHLLLIVMGKFGESIEVFRVQDSTRDWEKIDDLGKHMIYISDTTCLCIEAKTAYMENKIYFPLLHYDSGYLVFYSLETCRYHTFSGKNFEESLQDFFGTTHHCFPRTWIEPSWS